MIDLSFLLLGILGLYIGTELTVRGAVNLARKYGISELFIGLTILAFGTDLPELMVALDGAIRGAQGADTSGVIVGNALGSSISQISIIIGFISIFHFLNIGKVQLKQMRTELIGSIVLLALVAFDNIITWNDGAILIISFLIYIFTLLQRERKHRTVANAKKGISTMSMAIQASLLVGGIFLVVISSDYTIETALKISGEWNIEESFIGAVIIGLGTSLPELAISLNAIFKKKAGLSIGNVVGSNIFDLLVPLGVASVITPITVDNYFLFFDLPFLLIISSIFLIFLGIKKGLQKREGVALISLYVFYAVAKHFFS